MKVFVAQNKAHIIGVYSGLASAKKAAVDAYSLYAVVWSRNGNGKVRHWLNVAQVPRVDITEHEVTA